MRNKRIVVSLIPLILIIILTFNGCAEKEVVRQPPPLPLPEKVTSEALLSRIDFSDISTLKAAIKLGIQRKGESKGVFSGGLIYSHPDRLNVRIFGPLGLTIMETLFDKGLLQLFIPTRDTVYSGSAPFDKLLPDQNTLSTSMKFFEETDNAYVLYLLGAANGTEKGKSDPALKAKYFFDKTTLSWNALELYADGKKQARIEIYKAEGLIPSDVGIYVRDAFFRLELKEIVINKALKNEYFKPLEASQTLPLSRFLRNLDPSQ